MNEQMNYTTAPCIWSDKDADIIADYVILKKLGLKNVSSIHDDI